LKALKWFALFDGHHLLVCSVLLLTSAHSFVYKPILNKSIMLQQLFTAWWKFSAGKNNVNVIGWMVENFHAGMLWIFERRCKLLVILDRYLTSLLFGIFPGTCGIPFSFHSPILNPMQLNLSLLYLSTWCFKLVLDWLDWDGPRTWRMTRRKHRPLRLKDLWTKYLCFFLFPYSHMLLFYLTVYLFWWLYATKQGWFLKIFARGQ